MGEWTLPLECDKCGRTDGRRYGRDEWLAALERDGWQWVEDSAAPGTDVLWCRYCYEG